MNKRVIITILQLIVVAGLLFYFYEDLKYLFVSQKALQEYLEGFGLWAPFLFVFIQALQVIIAPIPGNVTALAGGVMFGPWKGFLLSGLGILLGSVIAFFMARIFGKPLIIKIVGQPVYEKYGRIFSAKQVAILLLIFLLPFFPDDALCFLAGLSSLPFPLFTVMVILGRMPGMLFASLAGAGLIDLSLYQWMIIAALSMVIIFIAIKYNKRIEDFLHQKLKLNGR